MKKSLQLLQKNMAALHQLVIFAQKYHLDIYTITPIICVNMLIR
ncbi:hypothetical protein HMPREF9346_05063 [Escherichia coli MS 119-7]|nr:hypothetical protein HMPREF9346_05063 [Escherichia coli MS 119-7]